jgi:hypothetical protein
MDPVVGAERVDFLRSFGVQVKWGGVVADSETAYPIGDQAPCRKGTLRVGVEIDFYGFSIGAWNAVRQSSSQVAFGV